MRCLRGLMVKAPPNKTLVMIHLFAMLRDSATFRCHAMYGARRVDEAAAEIGSGG